LLARPSGVTWDGKGNLYIADSYNSNVRKVALASGQITTIAGTGLAGFSGDGSAATSAQLNGPSSVALDSLGNLYIYDAGNYVIRKVDTNGIIRTFAGTPQTPGSSGDGGPATKAQFKLFAGGGLTVDANNSVYIADTLNSAVRRVTKDGNINTIAGMIGKFGSSGDGHASTAAMLSYPAGLAFDPTGSQYLYIADFYNQEIRQVVAKDGTIRTVAGNLSAGYGGDGGPATAASLNYPIGVATDAHGNIYIGDTANNVIRKVTAGNPPIISTIAGNAKLGAGFAGDGGPATSAQLNNPEGVAVDGSGTVYIADLLNHRIRAVSGGTISEVAGADHAQGDGGKATAATLFFPQHVAEDSAGNLYIADTSNNEIRKVALDGTISTVAKIVSPAAVVLDSTGNIFVAHKNEIVKVDSQGNMSTVAGSASTAGFSGDGGLATSALLNQPFGLALDSAGNLYIADTSNHRIRKISVGNITTVAGSGAICGNTCDHGGYSGDGGPATSATMSFPADVALDSSGNLLIADSSNSVIRRVDSKGNITTVAGTGHPGFSGDGGPAGAAVLDTPDGVAADNAGNIFIADTGNQVIRVVDGFGIISTIAGNNKAGFSGDAGPGTSAELDKPFGLLVDPSGNVFFVDSVNNRIRELTPSGPLVPSTKSVVNAASFASGGVVPGGMATLFGSNLTSATGINLASGLPLATQFLGATVKFNNSVAAPIFAVDNVNGAEQINFQVPFELAGLASVVMQVENNGALSLPVTVPVLAAQPGVFAYYVGATAFGVVLHANFQLADSGHPVTGGETVLVYCTNLGAVSPTIKDGVAGSGKELTVAQPTAMIGGSAAPVSFSGLAPGFVALYQVNVQIPKGLTSGNQPLVLTISGASSSPVMVPVK
jgi:uncharacterized protein (TIGR03437 family)